uniref:Uncharacterized protein n=1 Tax=Latimeria chalumnae TaxID=7897 RepID=H3ASM7_LATCH
QLLRVRAEDVPELKDAIYYALILDETTDVAVKEQVSLCFRIVSEDCSVKELFDFNETPLTNAQTLFTVVKDVVQFNLDIRNCRGQCYDGVANVSGVLSGLQARVKAEEPRAVYVHRMAHSLNLVVQDVMQHILFGRNFLTMIRELIICIPISPKKFACIEALQKTEDTAQRLHPFCPTRWCLHVTSLRSVDSNYATLLKFLDEIGNSDVTDTGAKAHRFLTQLQKFNTFF